MQLTQIVKDRVLKEIDGYVTRSRPKLFYNNDLFNDKTDIARNLRQKILSCITIESALNNINDANWAFFDSEQSQSSRSFKHKSGRSGKLIANCTRILASLIEDKGFIPISQMIQIKKIAEIAAAHTRRKTKNRVRLTAEDITFNSLAVDLSLLITSHMSCLCTDILWYIHKIYDCLSKDGETLDDQQLSSLRQITKIILPYLHISKFIHDEYLSRLEVTEKDPKAIIVAVLANFKIHNLSELFKNNRLRKILYIAYMASIQPEISPISQDNDHIRDYLLQQANSRAVSNARFVSSRLSRYNPDKAVAIGRVEDNLVITQGIDVLGVYNISSGTFSHIWDIPGMRYLSLSQQLINMDVDSPDIEELLKDNTINRLVYDLFEHLKTTDICQNIIQRALQVLDRFRDEDLTTLSTLYAEYKNLLWSDIKIMPYKNLPLPKEEKYTLAGFDQNLGSRASGIADDTKALIHEVFRFFGIVLTVENGGIAQLLNSNGYSRSANLVGFVKKLLGYS